MGLWHQYDGSEEGFDLFDEFSANGAKYLENKPNEMRARWRSFEPDLRNTNPVTAATIIKDARAAGWRPAKNEDQKIST